MPKVAKPPQKSVKPPKCLTPSCNGPQSHRGLCPRCWGKAKKAVEAGQTTLDDLVRFGLLKSIAESSTDPFTAALQAAQTKEKS